MERREGWAKQRGGVLIGILIWLGLMHPGALAQTYAALPDLVVTDLQLSPQFPQTNQITEIEVTVQNVGQGSAAPSQLVLRINAHILSSQLVSALAPGEHVVLNFGWVARKGKQVMLAQANAFGDIQESSLQNNALERVVEFTPDLVVDAVSFEPAHPQPNAPSRVVITVKNVGGQPTDERAAVRFKDGRTTLQTLFVPPLEPGQSARVSLPWRPQSGEHVLRFEVDAFKAILESDELNNSLADIVNISPILPTGANLIVRSIEAYPMQPQPGEQVTLSAVVANVGSGMASPFEVSFTVDGRRLEPIGLPSLNPGQQALARITWTAVPGERWVRVKADAQGRVVETDETDNVQTIPLRSGQLPTACAQLVFLELEPEAAQLLASALGVSEEEISDVLLPLIKSEMERDFFNVNLHLTLQKPELPHSRLRFLSESRQAILGVAPLDFGNRSRNDVGTVFLGSFVSLGLGRAPTLELAVIAQAIANTASHELGHLLGLVHDGDQVSQRLAGRNLMAASNEAATFFEDAYFTEENLAYLQGILPMVCGE
ncbi:MAG TPA: CARDB domain-containing protein [Candidatus Bipolaricaulota bacterium]